MIKTPSFLVLVTVLSLFPQWSSAQDSWRVQGFVQDSLKQQLPHCLVYCTRDQAGAFLDFKYTDEQGQFELQVPADLDTVRLHVRMLGYKTYNTLILRGVEQPLLVGLKEEKVRIKEVVVEGKRPPIIEKSDTTVFDAKQFSDSTEFAVEDLLGKIPGIEVKADGSISVNGQSIKKVLIEGDDLFGSQYTIGTRNIRAEYIDQVEVIQRFQENPVLKEVNLSDAIAINLKIKEEKKNIINGIVNIGSGWGQELKGTLHANVFSISKQTKVILLTDNGNVGNHYSFQDLTTTYRLPKDQNHQSNIIETPRLINNLDTENPGVPASFVDNGLSQFSSLRGIHNLNKNWNVHLNGVFSKRNDFQTLVEQTSFAFDDIQPYDLNLAQENELQKTFLSSDAQINYLNDQQSTSFNSYFSWEKLKDFGAQTVVRDFDSTNNNFNLEKEKLLFTSLYSQKMSTYSVGQLQLKMEKSAQIEGLRTKNEDLINYFELQEEIKGIQQDLDFSSQKLEFLGKYLLSINQTIVKLESFYTLEQSNFKNHSVSFDENINLLPEGNNESEVDINTYGLKVQLQQQILARLFFDWNAKATQNEVSYSSGDTQLPAFSTKLKFNYFFTNTAKGSIAYFYGNSTPAANDFWITPYLANQFTIYEPGLRDVLRTRHEISLNFSNREDLNFRNYYFNFSYRFGGQEWDNNAFFEQSLMIIHPFLAQDNRRLRLIGNFQQFIPSLATNLTLGGSFLKQRNRGVFQEVESSFFTQTARFRLDLKTKINRKINFLLKNSFAYFQTTTTALEADLTQTTLWENRAEILFKEKTWDMAFIFSRNTSIGKNGQDINLLTSQVKISKDLNLWNRPSNLELRINNLFNTGTFDGIQNTPTFTYFSSVPAIPRFFLLKLDFSF